MEQEFAINSFVQSKKICENNLSLMKIFAKERQHGTTLEAFKGVHFYTCANRTSFIGKVHYSVYRDEYGTNSPIMEAKRSLEVISCSQYGIVTAPIEISLSYLCIIIYVLFLILGHNVPAPISMR